MIQRRLKQRFSSSWKAIISGYFRTLSDGISTSALAGSGLPGGALS